MFIKAALVLLITWDALKAYLGLSSPIIQFVAFVPVVVLGLWQACSLGAIRSFVASPFSVWLLWIAYALANTFLIEGFNPHRETSVFVFVSSIVLVPVFLFFLVSRAVSTEEITNIVLVALVLRMLLSLVFDSFGVLGGDSYARFGAEFNANAIAAGALFAVIVAGIKIDRDGLRASLLIPIGLGLGLIVATASVKFALALIFFGLLFFFRKFVYGVRPNRIFGSVLALALCGGLAVALLPSSNLGGRVAAKVAQTAAAERDEQLFDNRAAQYILGWEAFRENPINGIGLRGFVAYSGNTAPLHSEYLVQFVECGLIGGVLFAAFYGALLWRLRDRWRLDRSRRATTLLHFGSVFTMLFLFLGLWNYNIVVNWVLVGLAARYGSERGVEGVYWLMRHVDTAPTKTMGR